MKNAITKQTLLHSVMGLAAASLLATSSSVFAAGDNSVTDSQRGARGVEQQQNASPSTNTTMNTTTNADRQNQNRGVAGTTSEAYDQQQNRATGGEMDQGKALSTLSPQELEDRDIVNLQGEELGNVQEVVTDTDGSISGVLVSVDGILGMGASEIFARAQDIRVTDDQLVWQTELDQDALLEQQQEYEAAATSNN